MRCASAAVRSIPICLLHARLQRFSLLSQAFPSEAHLNLMHCLPPHQVVTAMGRTWHPEHFVCTHCQEEIGSRNFFEREGQPYCETDYHNLFSPRCYYCNGPILDVSHSCLHM